MRYAPADGTWEIIPTAGNAEARAAFSDEAFDESRKALRVFLCNYFSNGDCNGAQGKTVVPVGATPGGGKILKVRWGLPGTGKSGGLRLSVVVYCEKRRVVIAEAFIRKDDPPSEAFLEAASGLD